MKKCNSCGETKPFDDMCKEKTYPDGYRPLCKACRAIKQQAYRAERPTPVEVKHSAPARQPLPFKPYIVNDDHYFYRNDGLKHIKSRGV